jgi:glutamate racemase
MNARPLGVFDSGIGGLTVVRALIERLPHENIVYFGDTARVPYGSKSPRVVREYAEQAIEFLTERQIKMAVIACNTVSAVAIDVVQKRAGVPVVGVIIPGALAAVASSRNKRIGVIGTFATVSSNAYGNAIRQMDNSVKVFARSCPLFVPLAEEGWTEHKATALIAKEYLFPLTLEKIDTLILGCTHYPILRQAIAAAVGPTVGLIDSGASAAEEVARVLRERDLCNTSPDRANLKFYVSDLPAKFSEIGERFLGKKMGRVERTPLP